LLLHRIDPCSDNAKSTQESERCVVIAASRATALYVVGIRFYWTG